MTDDGIRSFVAPDPTHFVLMSDGSVALRHESQLGDGEVGHPLPANWQQLGANAWDLDPVSMTMVEAVERERATRWAAVKRVREAMLLEPVEVEGIGFVDTKGDSRAVVSALANKADELYPIEFKLANNVVRPCTMLEMQSIDKALELSRQAIRAAAEAIRGELYDPANDTVELIRAVGVDLTERLT